MGFQVNKFEKVSVVEGERSTWVEGRRNTSIDKRTVCLQLKDFPVHYKRERMESITFIGPRHISSIAELWAICTAATEVNACVCRD